MKAFNYSEIDIEDVIKEIEETSETDYNSYSSNECGVTVEKLQCSSGKFAVVVDGEQEFLSEAEDEVDAFIVGMRQGYYSARERLLR